jgi:hypothetical protein
LTTESTDLGLLKDRAEITDAVYGTPLVSTTTTRDC